MKPTVNFGSRPRVRKSKCPSVCFQWLQLREVHLEVCELQVLVKFALVGTVTVLAQLCFNIVFYYSMLLWNDCSYLATKLLKSELQMHRETRASCWLWALTDTAIVNMSTLVLHT